MGFRCSGFTLSRDKITLHERWLSTITRPSRARILPRGAMMGSDLIRLRSAISLYISGLRTWRSQKPDIRNRKMATVMYWNTATRPAANLGSSRNPVLEDDRRGFDSSGKSVTGRPEKIPSISIVSQNPERRLVSCIFPLNSCALFYTFEEMKQRNGHNGVEQAKHEGALGFEVHLLTKQRTRENPKDELMENKEQEAENQADQRVIHVQPLAHRSGDVADDRLGDAEHAERVLGKRILGQADDGAYQQSADGVAAHEREIYGDDEGQLEISQELKKQRDIDLKQDRRQRDKQ